MATKNEIVKLEKETNEVLDKAKSLVIKTQDQYLFCAEFLKRVKQIKKQIDEAYDEGIENAHKTWKGLLSKKKEYYDPLEQAEKIIKQKSIDYIIEQEAIQKELQRKAEEEARKAEEKRKSDLEAQAKKWEEKGNIEKAKEKRQMMEDVFVPIKNVDTIEISKDQIKRSLWKARIKELDLIPRKYLIENKKQHDELMSVLNRIASSTKGLIEIPGVEFYEEKILAVKI